MNAGEVANIQKMAAPGTAETDMTCQAFAQWLSELKARNARSMQEMLAETCSIRDGITNNNVELTDFKRHSTGISQQLQAQLTDLREKLTNAFSEITQLVKQKTQADQEMMQDINRLQQDLANKTQDLETLKRSYSQAHTQLQSSLVQIQNHLQVTNTEVQAAKSSCSRVTRDSSTRFSEIDTGLRSLEEEMSVGNAEHRNHMLQLQEEVARINESLASVTAEFGDHKRSVNQAQNRIQGQVWGVEDGRRRQEGVSIAPGPAGAPASIGGMGVSSIAGASTSVPMGAPVPAPSYQMPMQAAHLSSHVAPGMTSASFHRPSSATLPVAGANFMQAAGAQMSFGQRR